MGDAIEKRDWVRQVLDVDVDVSAGGSGPTRPLMPIWADAKDEVDTAIGKLQQALRDDGDGEMLQIAEYGLHKVTDGQIVEMMAALRDADSLKTPEALDRVADAIEDFRAFLASSPGVDVIEHNESGIEVPLRKTLGAALDAIAAALG